MYTKQEGSYDIFYSTFVGAAVAVGTASDS